MAARYTLLNRSDYFEALVKAARSAGKNDRIAITTMTYDPTEPLVARLMRELCGAATRGANVTLLVDAYSMMVNEETKWPGPLWYRPSLRTRMWEPFRGRLAALEALRRDGGAYTVLNMPQTPFSIIPAGRSHIKLAVANDTAFVGGCNLRDVTRLDVMVGWRDGRAADLLYDLALRMHTTGSTRLAFRGEDRSFTISPEATFLLDAGSPKQSLIYDHALALIDDADDWILLTSWFFPGGRTGRHLHEADRRGVKVQIAYCPPRESGRFGYMMSGYTMLQRRSLPAHFFAASGIEHSRRIHAKMVVSEKGAIVGSHNLITQGITFGTAELSLQVMDPRFAVNLTAFTKRLLGQ
jgi:phosphatidylserine/phosphatidylglycerophosphate/cardiolipin synthase-like enzyme